MENKNKIILDLCGGTGSWSKPYVEAGYKVVLITWPEFDVNKVVFYRDYMVFPGKTRLIKVRYDKVHGVLAAPPCTEFSIAKDHTLSRDLIKGFYAVQSCYRIIWQAAARGNLKWWALENPVGYLRDFLGNPVFSFQPWWFGDGWSKRTMLWGNFKRPKQRYKTFNACPQIPGLYIRPGRKVPSIAFNHKGHKSLIPQLAKFNVKTDADFRSITPPAFAEAFFKANQ